MFTKIPILWERMQKKALVEAQVAIIFCKKAVQQQSRILLKNYFQARLEVEKQY